MIPFNRSLISMSTDASYSSICKSCIKSYEKPTTGIIMRPSKNFSQTKSNRLFIHFILRSVWLLAKAFFPLTFLCILFTKSRYWGILKTDEKINIEVCVMCDNSKKKARSITMTTGSLWRNLFLFSIPLMCSQLLEVMFNLSDVAVVGRFADYRALGAVGSTTLLVTLFVGFLIGMGSGVNVCVAHTLGAVSYTHLTLPTSAYV